MRVAIDATALTLSSGGLARYTLELSLALAENFPGDQFVLLSDQPFALPQSRPNLAAGGGPRNRVERRWWLWGLERELARQRAGLFHGPNFSVPYLQRRPSVLSLHDLSPWMDPAWHSAADRVRERTPPLIRLGLATMILTDTEAVRRQAIDYFRISPARIVSAPLAASSCFRPQKVSAGELGLSRPYFLYAGALEPRKNIAGLLEAWRHARRQCPVDLVLAGRSREDFRPPAAEPGLHRFGEVSDDELARLYSGALAFVYPSFYEGFGLPVLEAMQCGACVIVSPDAALREVAGDAGVIAASAAELAQAMVAAATRPEWVGQKQDESLQRARCFSWSRTARLTREVYEEAGRRFAY